MSEAAKSKTEVAATSLWKIFTVFLFIGATSFGGGVVAYLRSGLVSEQKWIDDNTFVELLSISQSLPGLNATNMAVLVGDRLRGKAGALAALIAICLPGAIFMLIAGTVFSIHKDNPAVSGVLHGVAAAAVGVVLSTTLQLGRRSLHKVADLFFVALAVIGINIFHLSVPVVLLSVGALSIFYFRPSKDGKDENAKTS